MIQRDGPISIPGEAEVRLASRRRGERLGGVCGGGGSGDDGGARSRVAGVHLGAADEQADEKPVEWNRGCTKRQKKCFKMENQKGATLSKI